MVTVGTFNKPKVVCISGGARGIGLAIAKEMLKAGWIVSIGVRNPNKTIFEGATADNLLQVKYDAADAESEKRWIQSTIDQFGYINAIVLNAGILSRTSIIDATDKEFDDIFNINVKSPMRLVQQVWPYLMQQENSKVVVMASLAGKRVRTSEGTLYAMSKAAALMLAHSIRHCGADVGIRATAICPGFVATDMANYLGDEEKNRMTQPSDIAKVIHTVLDLPFSASIAEVPIAWNTEPQY